MALLTDLPAELRQQIIRLIPGSMPKEIQLDHARWPEPVNSLLATCKLLRADTIQIMRSWTYDCVIPRSSDIHSLVRLEWAMQALGLQNKVHKIRLLVFTEMSIEAVRDPRNNRELEYIMAMWKDRCRMFCRGAITTVVVDATPLPRSILADHPNLIPVSLVDMHLRIFVSKQRRLISRFMSRLSDVFNYSATERVWESGPQGARVIERPRPVTSAKVSIVLGGQFGEYSIKWFEQVTDDGRRAFRTIFGIFDFVAISCDREMRESLSMHRLISRCGISIDFDWDGWASEYKGDNSGIALLGDLEDNESEVEPDCDFSDLNNVQISKHSAASYYLIAQEDIEGARAVVINLLKIKAESCRSPITATRHMDFCPAAPHWRRFMHQLSHDLELESVSIDGEHGTFVRVTLLPDGQKLYTLEQRMKRRSINPNLQTT
ncbi:hypothetical protein Daus18300_012596 [Diaporthe australafricana]|uniref:F-box domain-containing protein n=1 Tax=Diaporthe australafricana TaxID=127596 RepID=A0ABR3W280_9PEZI